VPAALRVAIARGPASVARHGTILDRVVCGTKWVTHASYALPGPVYKRSCCPVREDHMNIWSTKATIGGGAWND